MLSLMVLVNYFNTIFLFALFHIQNRRKSVSDFNTGMKTFLDALHTVLEVVGKKKNHSFCRGITG